MSKNYNMENTNYQDAPTITPDALKLRRENGRAKILIEPHYPDAKIITLKSGGAYIELAKHVETTLSLSNKLGRNTRHANTSMIGCQLHRKNTTSKNQRFIEYLKLDNNQHR